MSATLCPKVARASVATKIGTTGTSWLVSWRFQVVRVVDHLIEVGGREGSGSDCELDGERRVANHKHRVEAATGARHVELQKKSPLRTDLRESEPEAFRAAEVALDGSWMLVYLT